MEKIAFKRIGAHGSPVLGKQLTANDPDSNDPAAAYNLEFVFSAGFIRWSLIITPRDAAGTNTDPSVDVKYWTGTDYQSSNPATGGTATKNKANVITREDAVTKVLVTVRAGANPVDGGVDVALFGTRVAQ